MVQVETYEEVEVTSEGKSVVEHDAEALKLIEELELVGQKSLCSPAEEGKPQQRSQYRIMTKDEFQVYRILCPKMSKLAAYNGDSIPLRVLQVAAHCKQLGIFTELQIWSKDEAIVKDPVLVGRIGDIWNGQFYILARWGSELLPFEQLRDLAAKVWRDAFIREAEHMVNKLNVEIASVKAMNGEALTAHPLWTKVPNREEKDMDSISQRLW